MSGAVKSGLIFGVVGIFAVLGFSLFALILPLGCVCGTLVAGVLGGAAGYLGVRWTEGGGIGSGVLAGLLAGIGALIGGIIFFVILISVFRSNPELENALLEGMREQNASITDEQARMALGLVGPVGGFCFGVLNLLIALAAGAIGGAIAGRGRTPMAPPPPMQPPPLAPMN